MINQFEEMAAIWRLSSNSATSLLTPIRDTTIFTWFDFLFFIYFFYSIYNSFLKFIICLYANM